MQVIDEFCNLLQVHVNRDKVVCLACYALKLVGSVHNSKPLLTASGKLAAARSVTRLFDDASAVRNLVNYGFGRQEGLVWGTAGVCNGLSILAYLQLEKLMFLIDSGVMKVSDDVDFKVRTGHKLAWSLLAFFGFLRSLRALHLSSKLSLRPRRSRCAGARVTHAALTSAKLLLDVIHVVSWLPSGWLWGSQLTDTQASSVATASAVLALIIHYHGKKLAR